MSVQAPTHVALLLHMHQPLYVDPATGQAALPWVRLHGARGYLDVAWLLERHPAMQLTVNFVPSLVDQLAAAAAGIPDRYVELARRHEWSPAERIDLLQRFFSIHHQQGIAPRRRYVELLDKRGREAAPAAIAARAGAFTDGELRDLGVLFHLAWLGFAIRRIEPHAAALAALERQGRDYSAADLETVLAAGQDACARVLPLWRQLAARGQVELIASPYYHPIVPLLCDSEAARRTHPGATLPERFAWPGDARLQIARGREAHARAFGAPPRGMWPPEGSLSPEALAAYRAEGIAWLATDEGILWRSLPPEPPREALHRPYRAQGVDLVFRDRELSDRIGFRYASIDAATAVDDLLSRLRRAGAAGPPRPDEPPLVAIILDGENPWESYPDSGEPFLSALFSALTAAPDLRPVAIGHHLDANPRRIELETLHSGSWIDADFHIWIGDPVKNRAWDLLGDARRAFARAGEGSPARREEALSHLLAAEGSDWFWWFGEPFHSAEDATFDRLFREHLAAAYRALALAVPDALAVPVAGGAQREPIVAPRGAITPVIDGRISDFFEWRGAGRYEVPRGAAMAETPPVSAVLFGCDGRALYLRLDPAPGLLSPGSRRIAGHEIEIALRDGARSATFAATLAAPCLRDGSGGEGGQIACQEVVEIALPFAWLAVAGGARIELTVRLSEGGLLVGRYPREGGFSITVPDARATALDWSA